jgi:hypothetical protein
LEQWNNGRRLRGVGPHNAECGMKKDRSQGRETRDKRRGRRRKEKSPKLIAKAVRREDYKSP